jgi:hypothetical protein
MSHQGGQIHADKNFLFLNPRNLRLSARRINLRPKWDFLYYQVTTPTLPFPFPAMKAAGSPTRGRVREGVKNVILVVYDQRVGQLKFFQAKFPIANIPLTINFYPDEDHFSTASP